LTNTNFISSIVKILETPKQKHLPNSFLVTTFRAQFPQVRGNALVFLKFWGTLGKDITKYYKVNDYILIEGYLKLKKQNFSGQEKEIIEITVLKLYPLLLSSQLLKNKSFE